MQPNENIYDQILEVLGIEEPNINILEEQIGADIQVEYFEHSKNHRADRSESEVLEMKDLIFDPAIAVDVKKSLLVQLASLDNVDAYRTIERYTSEPDTNLYHWACIALQESKLLLESKILEENKILITTGLGGRGLKLRYFLVLFTESGNTITSFQNSIISKELTYGLNRVHAEIEDLSFKENLVTLLTIIPLKVNIQELFRKIIDDCNCFGNFLFNDFIVTNVKILEEEEIEELLAINNIY